MPAEKILVVEDADLTGSAAIVSRGRVVRPGAPPSTRKRARPRGPSLPGLRARVTKSPAPFITNPWKARMFTRMGPSTSSPRFRVRGTATSSPPITSNTLTKVR